MTSSIVLYGTSMHTSPYVLSCFVTLREKGIAFEHKTVALTDDEHKKPPFNDRALTMRAPALVDGDFSVAESSAIVEYLEERFPAPAHANVLPKDLHDRARARQIMAWVRSDLMPIREERSSEYVFYPHSEIAPYTPLSDAAIRAVDKLVRAADRWIPKDGGPLFGAWSIADTDLAMMLQRLHQTQHPLPPHVVAFTEREWKRPSVAEFVALKRPRYVGYS